jgi:hypothetical protein
MAILDANGITFSDSSTLTTRYGIVPQSSVKLFFQAAAPTGWTKLTTHNDKCLRLVGTTGGGSGGTTAFSTIYSNRTIPTGSVTTLALSSNQIPSHSHSFGPVHQQGGGARYGNINPQRMNPAVVGMNNAGASFSHTHPSSVGPVNLTIQYIDVILCSLD